MQEYCTWNKRIAEGIACDSRKIGASPTAEIRNSFLTQTAHPTIDPTAIRRTPGSCESSCSPSFVPPRWPSRNKRHQPRADYRCNPDEGRRKRLTAIRRLRFRSFLADLPHGGTVFRQYSRAKGEEISLLRLRSMMLRWLRSWRYNARENVGWKSRCNVNQRDITSNSFWRQLCNHTQLIHISLLYHSLLLHCCVA